MPSDYVERYLKRAQMCKEHNIKMVCELLSEDEAFYKAVVNYSQAARRDVDWH